MTTSVTPHTCSYRSHTVFVVVLRSIHLLLLALSRLPALSPTGYGPRSLHRRTFRRLSQFLDLRKLTVHRPILQPFFPAFPSDFNFLVRFCGRFSRTSIRLQQDSIFVLSLPFFLFLRARVTSKPDSLSFDWHLALFCSNSAPISLRFHILVTLQRTTRLKFNTYIHFQVPFSSVSTFNTIQV